MADSSHLTAALVEQEAAIDSLERRVARLERRLLWMLYGSVGWAVLGVVVALGYALGVRL